jgi:hypothetical protein
LGEPFRSVSDAPSADPVPSWVDAVIDRHTRGFTRSEFLKSVRALSARYVERRAELPSRSVLDSAGKRAAFAGFYAPLHLITARAVARAIAVSVSRHVTDLGCGTGAAGAGLVLAGDTRTAVSGVDMSSWALQEAAWNWRELRLSGRTRRDDLVQAAARLVIDRRPAHELTLVLGWSVNELPTEARARLLEALTTLVGDGAGLMLIEPIARSHAPWWPQWVDRLAPLGAATMDWKAAVELPERLADIDKEAGFRRDTLSARVLWCAGSSGKRVA